METMNFTHTVIISKEDLAGARDKLDLISDIICKIDSGEIEFNRDHVNVCMDVLTSNCKSINSTDPYIELMDRLIELLEEKKDVPKKNTRRPFQAK
jgi:translation elongation factor EF-Tu-like GTPase